jgi:predicted GNAT family N-acyltransferase
MAPSARSTAPGTESWSDTRLPDAATTCAIPPPIWPAPTTRTCSKRMLEQANVRTVTTVRPATVADADAIGRIQVEHPSSWGSGAGRLLIERAAVSLREFGFPHALLWVLEGNERAERFYRTAGWVRDGEKQDTFQGVEVVELRYRKSL